LAEDDDLIRRLSAALDQHMKESIEAADTAAEHVLSKVDVSGSHVPTLSEAITRATDSRVTRATMNPPHGYRVPTMVTATIDVPSLFDVQMVATIVQLSPALDSSTATVQQPKVVAEND
jgi:hypothetical protein